MRTPDEKNEELTLSNLKKKYSWPEFYLIFCMLHSNRKVNTLIIRYHTSKWEKNILYYIRYFNNQKSKIFFLIFHVSCIILIKKTFLSLYTIYFAISCDFYNTKNVNIIHCLVVQSLNVAHHQFYDLKEIDKDIIE